MKIRLIALVILIVLIGGPAYLYWYFVTTNISSLTITTDVETPFRLDIQGTFDYHYLPLADKLIEYHIDCQRYCSISPIPPAIYTIKPTIPGYEMIEETVTIGRGDVVKKKLELRKMLYTIEYRETIDSNPEADEMLLMKYGESLSGGTLKNITRKGDKLFFLSSSGGSLTLGYMDKMGEFTRIASVSGSMDAGYLDSSDTVFVFPGTSIDTLIELETGSVAYIPHTPGISLIRFDNGVPYIQKEEGTGYYEPSGNFVTNIRFTDSIGVDSRYRLGYIDPSDTRRKALQNIYTNGGFLFLIDTSNGKLEILKEDFEMMGFIRIGDRIGYLDKDGKKFVFDGILER